MQNPWYLFVVYGLVWVGIFFYVRRFFGQQRDLEHEIEDLAETRFERE